MKQAITSAFSAAFAVLLLLSPVAAHAATPNGFEDLAEKLLPTVVNVSTTTKIEANNRLQIPQLPELPQGSPFDQFFKDFYDHYRNAPAPEQKTNALGSGFIVDAEKGYIVTNNHVIKDADEIKIILQDNTSINAVLVGTDEKTDIAVLKADLPKGGNYAAAKWGDSDSARIGSWVIAIGNPFGLGGTVTAGIVSARQRDIHAGPYDDFIQTDASINRGNSGGPMFNAKGEVIGVNTAIFSPSGGSVGIGFAVPAKLAQPVVDQLIQYGKTKRGWIGVRIQDVTDEIAESLGLGKARGALVSAITPDGPSEKAGVKTGDVILSFDGKNVEKMRDLPLMVAQTEIGKKVDMTVWRQGKEKKLGIKLGQLEKAEEDGLVDSGKTDDEKAPADKSDQTNIGSLGIGLVKLDDELRKTYGVPDNVDGVVVVEVERDGAAADKGVAVGDVISEIDQKEVKSPKDAAERVESAIKDGKTSVLLFIARKTDMRFIAVKLPKK